MTRFFSTHVRTVLYILRGWICAKLSTMEPFRCVILGVMWLPVGAPIWINVQMQYGCQMKPSIVYLVRCLVAKISQLWKPCRCVIIGMIWVSVGAAKLSSTPQGHRSGARFAMRGGGCKLYMLALGVLLLGSTCHGAVHWGDFKVGLASSRASF